MTINMLHDDILLEIFDSYGKLVIWIEGILYWQKLLYVCRRWRYLILGSARHLDLQIRCFRDTHVRKLFDTWPAIPISIICRPSTRVGTRSNHNIIAALQRRDVRVGDPTSARAGGCRSLPRCIALLLPDLGKLLQRPGRTGRMIPTPRDLSEG